MYNKIVIVLTILAGFILYKILMSDHPVSGSIVFIFLLIILLVIFQIKKLRRGKTDF